jgi:methylenetetrahydrofolate dehydrogenase (NADP+)/methenyltetrahydrofolate cyclohydrolase
MANIIDGKTLAQELKNSLGMQAAGLAAGGTKPRLAVILVGDDPASAVYVRNKTKACHQVGIDVCDYHLNALISQSELVSLIYSLNSNTLVDGILLQLPLPRHLDSRTAICAISPDKDVDGLHPISVGRLASGNPAFVPCTPLGVMHILRSAGVRLSGTRAAVLGRSMLVGKPIAFLLLAENCTVTMCHSHTADLPTIVGNSDIVVAAVGQPRMVKGSWIKEGSAVVDVGINRIGDRLVGDVEFEEAAERAAVITPVPGGVGPLTIAMLLSNTIFSAQCRAAKDLPKE